MIGELQSAETPRIKPLEKHSLALQILMGVLITLGMASLWALENVRNLFFRFLDWARLKPRPGRASAFPPGRPRKLRAPRVRFNSATGQPADTNPR